MSDFPTVQRQHRFDESFERRAHELYNDLCQTCFEPALQTLRMALNDLLKVKFDPTEKLRLRVEEGRIKNLNRLLVKASSKEYSRKIKKPEDIFRHITDLVGTRITCNVTKDAKRVVAVLMDCGKTTKKHKSSIKLCKRISCRNYMDSPQESGYRAYHVFVEIVVPSGGELRPVICEVQIRTLLQDAWGELTHEDIYKPGMHVPQIVASLSKRLATALAVMDEIAQDIRDELDRAVDVEKPHAEPPANRAGDVLTVIGSPIEPLGVKPQLATLAKHSVGEVTMGEVVYCGWDYALIQLPSGKTGLLHWTKVGEVAAKYVDVRDYVSVGKTVKVKVLRIANEEKRIELELIRDA